MKQGHELKGTNQEYNAIQINQCYRFRQGMLFCATYIIYLLLHKILDMPPDNQCGGQQQWNAWGSRPCAESLEFYAFEFYATIMKTENSDFNLSEGCLGTNIIRTCTKLAQVGVYSVTFDQVFAKFQCPSFSLENIKTYATHIINLET